MEPLVSSLRSSSTTSDSPSLARWWAIEAPPTPPPMMTTRARPGSSRGLTTLLTPSGHEPFLEVRPHDRLSEALEVLIGVALEVEVEL